MEKTHENVHVLCFHVKFKRAQKLACFHVNFPFNAYFYPPLHHNGKGSIAKYQFAGEHTLEEAGAISEEDEGQDLSLLPQAVHPPTDLYPLPSVGHSFIDLDLKGE